MPLSDEQKGQICGILSVGCDRETAANFVGCSLTEIGHMMQLDPAFALNILRTEAGTELSHMRNVQQAAKDVKNWRASVWWLERHSPERFGARGAGEVTVRQLKAFVETLAGVLNDEFQNEEQRKRVIGRLDQAIRTLEEMMRSAVAGAASPSSELLLDDLESAPDFGPANLPDVLEES